ncbi:MAG: hypothetical protein PHQ34_12470 [Methanothrix sp.]|nr:hypothetical protein [Methanothrix sp.]
MMKALKILWVLEYDERKYRSEPKTYNSKIGTVTVPEDRGEEPKLRLLQ